VDRDDVTLVSLWIHVPFITTWIGLVMLDAFATFAPGLSGGQRAGIIAWSRPFVLLAIPVILATGIWQTMENPFYRVESYSDLSELRHRTLYGDLLFWKHACVIATFVLTIAVRFVLAPRLQAGSLALAGPGDGALAADSFRLVQAGAVLNLAACLGALLLATRMVVELH
jgi:putative copper export protein